MASPSLSSSVLSSCVGAIRLGTVDRGIPENGASKEGLPVDLGLILRRTNRYSHRFVLLTCFETTDSGSHIFPTHV